MNKNFETLAKGRYGKVLLEVCEDIKRQVADIRNDIPCKPEVANEVRIGVIGVLDRFLVDKLKVLTGELQEQDPNEHL